MYGEATMKTFCWGAALFLTAAVALGAEKPVSLGHIERLDPRFDELVPKDAAIEMLVEDYQWSEGPVWAPDGGYLLFSDIPRNRIVKWTPGEGASDYLKPSGQSNGLLLDAKGRLVLCQHADRRMARQEADGTLTTLAGKYDGKRFHSPNDAAYKSNGDLYFTDPPYGLAKQDDDPARELDFNGVFRLSADGKVTLLTRELTRPNGIGFSPDEKNLYVANSDAKKALWMVYDVKDDGTIANGRVFCDVTEHVGKLKGVPDGLKIDAKGNVFATGPGGVNVMAPDGTLLGRINPEVATANCAFGADGWLYLTAHQYLARVKTRR
jgi:gluconolactonase